MPVAIPLTSPVVEPTVATAVALLLHVPPGVPVGFVKVYDVAIHRLGELTIAPAVGGTHASVIVTSPSPVLPTVFTWKVPPLNEPPPPPAGLPPAPLSAPAPPPL